MYSAVASSGKHSQAYNDETCIKYGNRVRWIDSSTIPIDGAIRTGAQTKLKSKQTVH